MNDGMFIAQPHRDILSPTLGYTCSILGAGYIRRLSRGESSIIEDWSSSFHCSLLFPSNAQHQAHCHIVLYKNTVRNPVLAQHLQYKALKEISNSYE